MTLDEARELLGTAPEADAKTVRRAYLRLLKHHKPDTDPQGFQRLRAAFEMASDHVGVVEAAPWSGLVLAELSSGAPSEGDSAGAERDEDQGDVDLETAGVEEARDEADAELQRALMALHDQSLDDSERVRQARAAVESWPASPAAHWALCEILEQVGLGQEIPAVLRAGDAAGIGGCFETLVADWPQALDQEEIARAEQHDSASVRLDLAIAMAETRPEQAATMGVDGLQSDDWLPAPPRLEQGLQLFLKLQSVGEVAASARVYAAVESLIEDEGVGIARHGPDLGHWVLVSEVFGLPVDFPSPIRAAMARDLYQRNAVPLTVRAEARNVRVALRRRAARQLKAFAPNLESRFASHLGETFGGTDWFAWAGIVVLLLGIYQTCVGGRERRYVNPPDTFGRATPEAIDAVCGGRARAASDPHCSQAYAVLDWVVDGRCDKAMNGLEELRGSKSRGTDASRSADVDVKVDRLAEVLNEMVAVCGGAGASTAAVVWGSKGDVA